MIKTPTSNKSPKLHITVPFCGNTSVTWRLICKAFACLGVLMKRHKIHRILFILPEKKSTGSHSFSMASHRSVTALIFFFACAIWATGRHRLATPIARRYIIEQGSGMYQLTITPKFIQNQRDNFSFSDTWNLQNAFGGSLQHPYYVQLNVLPIKK